MRGSHLARALLGLLLVGWLVATLTCSPEDPVSPEGLGSFELVLRFPPEAPSAESADSPRLLPPTRAQTGPPDSIRLVVTDGLGRSMARAASGIDQEDRFRLEVDLRAGGPYLAVVTVESEGRDPSAPSDVIRAGLHLGTLDGIRIEPGETTRDTLTLRSLLSDPFLAQGQPGDLTYTVSWNRVGDATAYDLLARAEPSGSLFRWETPDTTRVFPLSEIKQMLRSRGGPGRDGSENLLFWVRARTRWILGHFDDSLLVRVGEWKDLPRVTQVNPSDGDSDVPDTAFISLRFSQPMDSLDLRGSGVEVRSAGDGAPLAEARRDIDADGLGVRIIPQGFLPNEESFEVRVGTTVRDTAGKLLDQDPTMEGLQGFVSSFQVEPYLWLQVTSADPSDGTQGVERRPVLRLHLTRPIDESTVEGSVTLTDSLGRIPAIAAEYHSQDTTLSVTPAEELPWGMLHTLRVSPSLLDLRGNFLDEHPETAQPDTFRTTFRVAVQPEGPQVSSVDPSPGATNVLLTSTAVVVFSTTVRPETVTPSSFAVRKPPIFANLPGIVEHAGDSLTFVFRPSSPLERGLTYRIAVTTEVTDPDGDPLDQDRSQEGYQEFLSEFRTEDNPTVLEIIPDLEQDVALRPSFTLRFSQPLDPSSVDESSVFVEKVENGVRVVSSIDLAAGALEVTVATQDSLSFAADYRLWATTEIRSAEGSFLDQDLETPGHDPFSFTFTTQIDSTPPRVIDVAPADGRTGVSESTQVVVTFEKPVKPSTVYEQTFVLAHILSPTDSLFVSGDVVVSADSVQAILTPDAPLELESLYRVWVRRFVSNPYGILLDQDPETPGEQEFRSEFVTRVEAVSPMVESVDPPDSAELVPLHADVVVRFSEPMRPGTIPVAFSLSKEGIAVPGDGVVSTDSLEWTYEPLEPLVAASRYTVEVDTTALDRVGNRLDQDPDTPGSQPFISVFNTVEDTVGPVVVAMEPPDGSLETSVGTSVTLTFSELVDPATVVDSTFMVSPEGGSPLSGVLEVLEEQDRARWTPAEPLDFSTWHRVTATPGITDIFGNELDQMPSTPNLDPYEATFKTQPETLSPRVEELVLPPAPVPVDVVVGVVFNEPVDPETVAPGGVDLLLGDEPAELGRWVSPSGDTAFVRPDPDLVPDMLYTFRVTPSVTDTLGNPLDQDPDVPGYQSFTKTFLTGPDDRGPRVVSVDPPDGATGISASPEIQLVFSEALDPTTVSDTTLLLTPESGSLDYEVELLPDGQRVRIELLEDLQPEETYEIEALHDIEDLSGNGLDQDRETPEPETFKSLFMTGLAPVLAVPAGLCQAGDSPAIMMDASGSSDPDGELVSAIWDWGDGRADTLSMPEGLAAWHAYACTDAAGCDSQDNDGDGATDEWGPSGCDESYKIILVLLDDDGFRTQDTTGVSFCDFRVLGSDPPDGATDVPPDTDVRVQFGRPALADSLHADSAFLRIQGGEKVNAFLALSDDGRLLVIVPTEPLMSETYYEVVVTTDVVSEEGEPLDQEPCEPELVGWLSSFRTAPTE